MSTSKKTLSARLQRKTLSLSEKIKLLDYKKSNPTIGCRDIAEIFNIGKTSAATIIKNEEKLRIDFTSFEGSRKRICQAKFHKLNEAMYLWYTKCWQPMCNVQEEALPMKEKMIEINPEVNPDLKTTYRIRETTTVISGETSDAPITMVKAWMERLPELVKSYSAEGVLNMEELGLFFKTLPQKGLVEK